jgi:hypothetical protein
MFLVEGVPSAILGIAVYFLPDDRPEKATWLSDFEKTVIADELEDNFR